MTIYVARHGQTSINAEMVSRTTKLLKSPVMQEIQESGPTLIKRKDKKTLNN